MKRRLRLAIMLKTVSRLLDMCCGSSQLMGNATPTNMLSRLCCGFSFRCIALSVRFTAFSPGFAEDTCSYSSLALSFSLPAHHALSSMSPIPLTLNTLVWSIQSTSSVLQITLVIWDIRRFVNSRSFSRDPAVSVEVQDRLEVKRLFGTVGEELLGSTG